MDGVIGKRKVDWLLSVVQSLSLIAAGAAAVLA
jgi:hypothetical protein